MKTEIEAQFQEALTALKEKKFPVAARLLKEVITAAPTFAPAHLHLGQLLAAAGKKREAEAALRRTVELAPKAIGGWRALAQFYRRQRNFGRARQAMEKAAQLAPDNIALLTDLLKLHRSTRDHAAALTVADRILALDANHISAGLSRAEALEALGRDKQALEQYDALLKSETVPNKALERWVQLMMKFERTEEALVWLQQRVQDNPQIFLLRLVSAGACVHLGNYAEALAQLEIAQQLEPENIRVMHDMGVTLRFLGRIQESKQWFGRVLERDPFHSSALRVYGTEHRYEYGDEAFRRLMRGAAKLGDYTPPGRVQLHYALGKCFDDVGDYATAFEHFFEGGKLHLRLHPQSDKGEDKHLKFVREHLTGSYLQNPGEAGCTSSKPIFVLGMPRSGTSLVEQVLASHPEVYGAGELKLMARVVEGIRIDGKAKVDIRHRAPLFPGDVVASYVERGQRYVEMVESLAGPDVKHVIDKMPGNYMWVGLIHLILPNAPIIHTRRHPVETCLSAYRIYFPDGQYWSFDLREMGKAYRRYDELMQYWRENLPEGRMLEVRYEDMVYDIERQARRLIGYCGLEWNDACLNFHETDRAVKTASASQVRKPIYKTSIGRWQKYEPYLRPLLEELGPLVQQYEDELVATDA